MQIQRMYKPNKKVKMAVGSMTPTPKKMSLRDTLAARRERQRAQRAGLQYTPTQPGRRAATPAEKQAAENAMQTYGNNANPEQVRQAQAQNALARANSAAMQPGTNQRNLAVAQANNAAKSPVAANVTQANNATKIAGRNLIFSRQAANAAPKPMMAKGGMVKANCGASMKPTQKGKK